MNALPKKQIAVLPAHNLFFTEDSFVKTEINKDFIVLNTKPVKTPFAFNSLVLSLSSVLNKGAAVLVQCSIKTEDGWSGLYKLAYISADYKKSFDAKADTFTKINIDTIAPKKPAQAFKCQLTVLGKAKIGMLCAAITNADVKYNSSLAMETLDLKDFELDVPAVSQMEYEEKSLRTRLCSPASLCAALNYYGKKVTLKETAQGVYDENADIYGNWPLNTAFAAQKGLQAGVVRCSSLAQAEGELYQGRPVIVSISYKNGELKNAAIESTDGHLVVICGIDANGDIIVMDPAAKKAKDARRVYDRKEFAKAWLKNKKGIAYAIGE